MRYNVARPPAWKFPAALLPLPVAADGRPTRECPIMKVTVTNDGDTSIRVIVDGDNVNDLQLAAGETEEYVTPPDGRVELRELGEVDPQT
jgi:hypothetical protein